MNKKSIGLFLITLIFTTNALPAGKKPLGLTPLHFAAMTGDAALLKQLLKENPNLNVNIPTNNGITPLHYATFLPETLSTYHFKSVQFTECIFHLLQAGALPNACDPQGNTPLHVAATSGHSLAITILCNHGKDLDINAQNNDGETPLYLASQHGDIHCLNSLIESGADVNLATNTGYTPLHTAAQNNNYQCVRTLVQAGADMTRQPHGSNLFEYTAENIAKHLGHCVIAGYLRTMRQIQEEYLKS